MLATQFSSWVSSLTTKTAYPQQTPTRIHKSITVWDSLGDALHDCCGLVHPVPLPASSNSPCSGRKADRKRSSRGRPGTENQPRIEGSQARCFGLAIFVHPFKLARNPTRVHSFERNVLGKDTPFEFPPFICTEKSLIGVRDWLMRGGGSLGR